MKNLKLVIKNAGLTQKEFAEKLNVSHEVISRYVKKTSMPNASLLIKMVKILGVSADYLLGIEEKTFSSPEKLEIKKTLKELEHKIEGGSPDDIAEVPLLEDPIAAGAPVPISGESVESRWFVRSWLRRFKNPVLVSVGRRQESMSPTVIPGDLLLIDRRPVLKPKKNAIYAVNAEEGGTIKRCSLAGGRLRLIPDNPNYSDKFIAVEDVDIRKVIVGRVVWIGRELPDPADEEETEKK